MKAIILQDGTLKVIPENETESYALRLWNRGFTLSADSPSTLSIDWGNIQPPQGEEAAQ